MMETHNEEANHIICNIPSNDMLHISKLFPVKATPGILCALPKLPTLSQLNSTKTNTLTTDGILFNTTQQIDKATNLNIGPHAELYHLWKGHTQNICLDMLFSLYNLTSIKQQF